MPTSRLSNLKAQDRSAFAWWCSGWIALALLGMAACSGGGNSADPVASAASQPPGPTTGTLRVDIRTSGSQPDADGYTLSLDSGASAPIANDGNLSYVDLPAGAHRVSLSSLDCNCTSTAPNPTTVQVHAGQAQTVQFDVNCAARSAQPQPVALGTGAIAPFDLRSYADRLVIVGTVPDASRRASPLAIGLLNIDGNLPLATEVLPTVQDQVTQGGQVLVSGTDVTVLSVYNQQCNGCMLHPGLGFARFGQPFSASATQAVADFTPVGSSTDLRQAFALAGGLALYQTGRDADRAAFASRYGFQGARDTIVPLGTSRGLLSMALAASPSSYVATQLDTLPPAGISTQPLTADGLPTGTPVTLETDLPTVLTPAGAAIAWCHDRFAAVWWAQQSYTNGHVALQLRARLLDATGAPLAGTVALTGPIDFTSEQEAKPIALSCLDDAGFLLAYVDPAPAIQLLTTDLDLVQTGSRTFATLTGVADGTGPHVVADAKQFGVAWRSKNAGAFYFSRACRAP